MTTMTRNWASLAVFAALALVPRPALAQGATEAAMTDFDAGRLDKAQAELQAILRARPDDSDAHETLARIFVKRGRTADALRQYRLSLQNLPNNGEATALASPVPDEGPRPAPAAVRDAQAKALLHPEDARAHDALGQALYERNGPGDERSADAEYRRAIRLNPKLAAPHIHRADMLELLGREAQAADEYRTALRLDPADAQAHNDYGFALSIGRRDEDALAEFEAALRLRPGYVVARHNLSILHSVRGDLLCTAGHYDQALAEHRQAVALESYPHFATARANLALCLVRAGRRAEAAAEYRLAIQTEPGSGTLHQSLARVLDDTGDLRGAVTEYREAVRLEPRFVLWRLALGLALYQNGDRAEARRQWQPRGTGEDREAWQNTDASLFLKQFP